jgi:hypothetical protein
MQTPPCNFSSGYDENYPETQGDNGFDKKRAVLAPLKSMAPVKAINHF